MHKKLQPRNSPSLAFRLKTVSAAVVSALVVMHASAAGLGKLTVLSGLGQPLRAEIELTAVSPDEARNLQPRLASMDAFRQANIEFNPTLQSLRFAIEQRGNRQFIQITTSQPVSEPFVDMLLELNGSSGRLVREYTFLLDPPEMRAVQPAQSTQGMAAAQPAGVPAASAGAAGRAVASGNNIRMTPESDAGRGQQPAGRAPAAATRVQKPAATPAAAPAAPIAARAPNGNSPGAEYQVRPGDSLSKIANRTRRDGISLDQMLVALYRANPDAFVGNNMNRLRAGQILAVPNTETSSAVPAAEASGIVIAQAADFNAYRNKLAGQVAAAPAEKAAESRQSASGKIAAKVEEHPTAANESLDKLKLSKADPAATGKAAAAQEDRIARDKAAAESAARVKDLEKNVSDLQKLLEVKNRDLAERQKNAAAATTVAVVPATAAVPAAAPKPAPATATPTPTGATPTPAATPQPPAATPTADAAAAVAAPVSAARQELEKVKAATPAATKPATPGKAKPAPETPEPGLFDDLLGNPLVQGGAVVLALLLGGLAWMRSRGRKNAKDFTDSTIPDSSLKANSLFGSTGGQSVDTNNSVFNSSFAPAASNLDSNEVDPVAEADVYIAYGRDAQAEEILKEALRTQPERHAVRVKLLEIYATRKDLRAFESVATELYSMSKGEGDDWAQAAAMGAALDPANPLYASGKLGPSTLAPDAASTIARPAEDSAALDAFLEEVSGAHPFADTHAGAVPVPPATPASEVHAVPAKDTSSHGADGLDLRLPVTAAAVAAVTAAAAAHADHVDHAGHAEQHDGVARAPEALPEVTPVLPAEPPADNSLDFDLDGLDFAPSGKPVAEAGTASTEAAPLSALDFDFLRDTPTAANPVPESVLRSDHMPAAPATPALSSTDSMIEFGEFHLPTTDVEEAPQALQAATSPSFGAGDLAETPAENPADKSAEHPVEHSAEHPADKPANIEETDFDLPTASASSDAMVSSAPAAPQPLEFDLSGITLDLPEPDRHDLHPASTLPPLPPSAKRAFDSGSHANGMQEDFTELDLTTVAEHDDGASGGGIGNNAEMATKLDLAVAYQEIGDHEGARELLDEVVKGGSAPQSDKARSLLARLG